jgi:hypothetical protein
MITEPASLPEAKGMAPVQPIPRELPGPSEPSLSSLVSGIIADFQKLIGQQLAMLRQELREDLHKTLVGARALIAGLVIVLVGGVFLLLMLPLLLHWAVPTLPLWACLGIMGGILLAVGGACIYAAYRTFESFNPLSDKSVEAFKENMQWTTTPK